MQLCWHRAPGKSARNFCDICHPPHPPAPPPPHPATHTRPQAAAPPPLHHHHHPRLQWRCTNDYNAKWNHGDELTRTPCRLARFLAGDMANHGSTRQPPRKKLTGCHHHQGFCDVCASLQNHQGQPPHLIHTQAPIVPALDPVASSL